ncbi:hypothetical protein [Pseudomonas silesiensis]|uniref:hypothetical protein n=1 Tax=Pseudomonas silesiensis TaxID=1853130 RepID=UPI0030D70B1F
MTHLTGEVQQIWAVLFGSNAVNEVLSGRRTVIRDPPETGRGNQSGKLLGV